MQDKLRRDFITLKLWVRQHYKCASSEKLPQLTVPDVDDPLFKLSLRPDNVL